MRLLEVSPATGCRSEAGAGRGGGLGRSSAFGRRGSGGRLLRRGRNFGHDSAGRQKASLHTRRLHARFHLRTRRRPLLSAFAGGHALCVSVSPCIFPARFRGSLLIRRDFGDLFSEQQKEGL